MSLKKQAGYGKWPPKKQDMGDEKNMWDMGEEGSRDRERIDLSQMTLIRLNVENFRRFAPSNI